MQIPLTHMIQHSFKSEEEAREWCRKKRPDDNVMVIHSSHKDNKNGDYFVDCSYGWLRNWETELYHGLGKNA